MSRLTRDGTAEPVSRDQILRHARGQGNVHFPCSADHEQDWQPYPVDPYSAICDDHTYIHTQTNRDPNRDKKLCDSTSNGTDQFVKTVHQISLLHVESSLDRSTRNLNASRPPSERNLSALLLRTLVAPISFDQQEVEVCQGHTSYKNK